MEFNGSKGWEISHELDDPLDALVEVQNHLRDNVQARLTTPDALAVAAQELGIEL